MTHPQSPASPLPDAAEPVGMVVRAFSGTSAQPSGFNVSWLKPPGPHGTYLYAGAAPSPVAQAPAQAGEVGAFEDWWYGHDGVRQRQVAYLGWPCTKELAESIWNGAREQAPSSLAVALQQAREALAYHQAQTRPIDKTADAIKAIDAALATQPLAAPVQQEAETGDDGGWTKHTAHHWSRRVAGDHLDYWPSRKKYQFRGRVMRGDVMAFIRKTSDPEASS